MAISKNNETPVSERQRREQLLDRQTQALERLAVVSDPTYKPKKKFAAQLIGLFMAGSAATLGGYEFVRFVIDSHEQRVMIANWVEAARELYEVEGNAEAANELLEKASEIAPQNPDVVKLSAYIQGMQTVEALINLDRPMQKEDVSKYAKAAGQAVMLERVEPESSDWAVLRGQLALVANEPDRARVYLQRAIELDPKNSFAVLRMALVHRRLSLGASDDATRASELKICMELLGQALKMDPNSKWVHLWLGSIALEELNDPVLARTHLESAIKIDPRFAIAFYSLGTVAMKLEEWPVAEKCFQRSLEIRPDLAGALSGMAIVYGSQNLYEIGLRYARKAVVADPGSLESWRYNGLLAREVAKELLKIGDEANSKVTLAEAITAYSNALDLDPRNGDCYIERSALYRQSNQLAEAGNDARNAVLFAPNDPYAWNALAVVQAQGGFHQEAVESFGKTIGLEAKFDEAYLGRAKSKVELREFDAAAADFNLALENASDDLKADILLARGMFRASRGDHAAALIDCVAARTKDERSFDAWIAEAESLKALGRASDSHAAARRALMLRPSDSHAQALADGSSSSTQVPAAQIPAAQIPASK